MQNLDRNVKIVNEDGSPTEFFMQLLQERGIGQQSTTNTVTTIKDNKITAGAGITVSGTGKLSDGNVPISTDVQGVLDQISATQGTVLYRDVAGWAALAPGASGQFLKTLGPGANPEWATGGGGGGGSSTTLGSLSGLLVGATTPSANYYLFKMIIADDDFTLNKIAFATGQATPGCIYAPCVYAADAAANPGALIGSGPVITGVLAGYNEAPLSAPVSITKGQILYVGVSATTQSINQLWATAGFAAYAFNGGSTALADPAPSVSAFNATGSVYGFWGVT